VRPRFLVVGLAAVLANVAVVHPAVAQSDQPAIDLIVDAGRPLRVALDERIQLKKVGQPVTGTVTEPVYAYDRVVIAVGTKVRGHVLRIDNASKFVRARAYSSGNFSPAKHAVLQFDALLLDDGREMALDTIVTGGVPNVTRHVAGGAKAARPEQAASSDDDANLTLASRARTEIRQRTNEAVSGAKQKMSDALASIKSLRQPGQLHRL
jgi:hypothetical protein